MDWANILWPSSRAPWECKCEGADAGEGESQHDCHFRRTGSQLPVGLTRDLAVGQLPTGAGQSRTHSDSPSSHTPLPQSEWKGKGRQPKGHMIHWQSSSTHAASLSPRLQALTQLPLHSPDTRCTAISNTHCFSAAISRPARSASDNPCEGEGLETGTALTDELESRVALTAELEAASGKSAASVNVRV